jgi:aminoglycoside/choline kinase family phosphotransferase
MVDLAPSPLLTGTKWATWTARAIPLDASTRRYTRLTGPNGNTAILLESDPAVDTSLPTFLRIAAYLTENGLCAPRVLRADPALGAALLSDLGPHDLTALGPEQAQAADVVARILARLDGLTPAAGLSVLDPATGGDMVRIAATHYGTGNGADALAAETESQMAQHLPPPTVMALRDVHSENLIWRPQAHGLARIGLLDFQDAVIAPPGYDLASFLRDVRRDIDTDTAQACLAAYCKTLNRDPKALGLHLSVLAAQRNLRILGIFARLAHDRKKPKFLGFLPRTWRLLMEDLSHPALHSWKAQVTATLPPPTASYLETLAP